MKILQVGLGGFGKNHLRVWHELRQEVFIADLKRESLDIGDIYGISSSKISTDPSDFLYLVDAIDVVTPTDTHHDLCVAALEAGKDVFVEKPIAKTSDEAKDLVNIVQESGRILQVGHLFRFNPAVEYIKKMIQDGVLGELRCLEGDFSGFKRCRNDVGVVATDAIHFIDLFNYFLNGLPDKVYAVTRDHFGRGLEDWGVVTLHYGSQTATVEVGNIQPGKKRDILIIGSNATIVCDVEAQRVEVHYNHHEKKGNVWTGIEGKGERPSITTKEPLTQELRYFMDCVMKRNQPIADARAGFNLLRIVEASYESARSGREVKVDYNGNQ